MRYDWPRVLPREFYEGLDQFNRREYFLCHETLEGLWIAERGSVRELFQGVIQIAVGCYHLVARHNFRGATRKLDAGARRIARAGPADGDYGVAWPELIAGADILRDHLHALSAEYLGQFDRALLPQARFAMPLALPGA